ncbi:hypothetical protein [Cypionkella sp.]|uniref:hypothetical protein n=1 Tax=Cypionkella sp. TaxID=2811411 RepID=UPI00272346CF|nr:hypothetical protein [Cypionkella sp.]MDO8982749.1 hypothetical protein [Cypionkella sp.]MDP2051459.1 hypothetical protein [Cypionkella sp.]
MTHESYAAQVAAEVAARYGYSVAPEAVQIIPRGVSSNVLPVWDGKQLVYAEESRISWRNQRTASYHNKNVSPKAIERRLQVAALHAEGLHDAAIAAKLGVFQSVVCNDRLKLGLAANPSRSSEISKEARYGQIRALIAQGFGSDAIAAELGMTVSYVRCVARHILAQPFPVNASAKKPRLENPKTAPGIHPLVAAANLRRPKLVAMVGGLGRTLRRDDLVQFATREAVSIKQVRTDMSALGIAWPGISPEQRASVKADRIAAHRAAQVKRRVSGRDGGVARDARHAQITAMDISDLTVADLAARFGVSRVTIKADLGALGIGTKSQSKFMTCIAEQTYHGHQQKIAVLHAEGKGWAEIKLATGLGGDAISRHLKACGLTLPRDYVNTWANRPRTGMTERVKIFRARLARLKAEGKTYAEMMAITGHSKASVGLHLREMGLTGDTAASSQRVAA